MDHLAVYIKNLCSSEILIYNLSSGQIESIKMDGTITPWINQNYDQKTLRFSFTSPLVYERLYEYNFELKRLDLINDSKLKGPEIVTNRFITKEVSVRSSDDEEIPMTLIHKSNLKLNQSNKWLLHGYGAYGLSMNLGFNIANLTAAERGWIIALAHVRGGGEKGPKWHEAGKLLNKHNSFIDFISWAEYLVENNYTQQRLLAAKGESAGGMLVAQVLNMRPKLFKASILKVPFLDVINTLEDSSLSLTITDYLEFGDPFKSEEFYNYISSYSPYENLKNIEYPRIYIDISLDDPRVPSWGSLK